MLEPVFVRAWRGLKILKSNNKSEDLYFIKRDRLFLSFKPNLLPLLLLWN
jgi:hypothetical protein